MAKKLLDTIKFLLRLISCVSICLLVVIVFMQVINRNFFDHSFTWVEEVASMAMVFITYLGAAMATINNGNTRIDFFIRKLPTPVYNAFELLDDVICIVFLVIVSSVAYKQMLTSWSMQTPANADGKRNRYTDEEADRQRNEHQDQSSIHRFNSSSSLEVSLPISFIRCRMPQIT